MAGKTVTFESKSAHFTLIRQHRVQTPLLTGGYQTVQKGITYKFQPTPSGRGENKMVGVLTVREGQDKLTTDDESFLAPGEEVGIERDAVKALMASRAFGAQFWVKGHEPGTLYPRPQDFRRELQVCIASLNEERLAEMLQEERGSHQRADLLAEVEDALEVVRETLAAAAAEAEAAKPAPKQKAAA
jgi:hypothetical protein